MKQEVDVIVCFSKTGEITPMRIRLVDEEGERRSFDIKSQRNISDNVSRTMPDGMFISGNTLAYECYIEVAGRKRMVRLYYTPGIKNAWIMTDESE